MFTRKPLLIHWRILDACNYQCDYCIANNMVGFIRNRYGNLAQIQKKAALEESPAYKEETELLKSIIKKEGKRFIAQKIVEYIQKSKREVFVTLTGGEIFLDNQLIDIFNHLSPHCSIVLDTNLSQPEKVKLFLETVDIKKIESFYISFHPEEIQKKSNLDQFINTVNLLKQYQLKYFIHYIYHPDITGKFQELIRDLNAKGIEVMPKPLIGQYKNKFYPEDYTDEERKTFSGIEEKYVRNFPRKVSMGKCAGGKDMIQIDPLGRVYRCYSCWIPHDTVLKKIKTFKFSKKCPMEYCFY